MLGCPDVWVSLSWKQCWCGKHFRVTVMDFLLCGYEPILPLKTHPLLGISCTVVYSNGWCGGYTVESICPISIREGSRCVNIDTRYVYRLLNGLLSDCWLDRVDLMKEDNHVPSAHWVRINDDAHFVCSYFIWFRCCANIRLCACQHAYPLPFVSEGRWRRRRRVGDWTTLSREEGLTYNHLHVPCYGLLRHTILCLLMCTHTLCY